MQELFRLFTKSNPVILNQESVNSFGIQSHPDKYQSPRFKVWLQLCKTKNIQRLRTEMMAFLQSQDSIKTIDELGKDWANVIMTFFAKGNQLTKEQSYQIINEAKPDTLFGKDKGAFTTKYTSIADTILSLAYLKNLNHKDNIDYQSVLKVMAYTERCIDSKFQLPELNILKYFEKPILLPQCFSKHNPCDEIIQTDNRFPFVIEQQNKHQEEKINGCKSDNCICNENGDCVKQSKCCVKPRIDKIELLVVKTETKYYRAGDISFIKNVLDGEKLSTNHRELNRTEEVTETESDIKQFEEKYLQSEDKTSLTKETEDVLKTDKGTEAGLTTNSSFGYDATVKGKGYTFDASGGTTGSISLSQSKSLTNKMVQDYSKDVINRSTKQLEQKIRNLSSIKKLQETEKTNKHLLKNESGEHINGQYLFVNKISRAQVYNYGKASVIDLILPEPAALYKRLFEKKFEKLEPVLDVKHPDEITDKNYIELIAKYNIKEFDAPPKMTETVPFPFNINEYGYSNQTYIENMSVTIPVGFEAIDMKIKSHNLDSYQNPYHTIITIGGQEVYLKNTGSQLVNTLPNLRGGQPVTSNSFNLKNIQLDMVINCVLSREFRIKWQLDIFTKVKEAFEKHLAAYKQEKEVFEAREAASKNERYNKNPFILRELEKAELKRMAISYISCQFYDQFDAMKNKVEPCGYPEMNVKEAYEEGLFVQFFEQAFNWNLMTYIFYPYFWGKKCGWGKSIKEEATDLIFEKFLQAGSCHVQIPIRPTHHLLVQHFIDYGVIWDGAGEPPLPSDPYYVSLAQEIKEQFQNFNTEREGYIDTMNSAGTNKVILKGNQDYWNSVLNIKNDAAIKQDIDREILIDYVTYRIVSIQEIVPASTNHDTWEITLDRDYKGAILGNIKWSTGSLYVGAPWEFLTPTNLVFLRNKSKCLPIYPLEECKE